MKTYLVEVWTDGMAYEAGQIGKYITVRANDASHAEDKAMASREYEVADCIGVYNHDSKAYESL